MTTPHDKAQSARNELRDKIAENLSDSLNDSLNWMEYREQANTCLEAITAFGGIVCAREPVGFGVQRMGEIVGFLPGSDLNAEYRLPEDDLPRVPLHAPIEAGNGGDGWLPIETAPKDRTIILLWHRDWLNPVMGYWSNVHNGWIEYGSRDLKANVATNWRPLPSPPSSSNEGEKQP